MTAFGARLPPNPRIVIVSTGSDPWNDRIADDLALRLHRRGWWVDRPDVSAVGVDRALRAGTSPSPFGHYLRERFADAASAWTASRLADRVSGTPHAVVGVHPLADRVLGVLRRSGIVTSPVVSYPVGPEVRGSCRSGGADAVLSPYPAVDRLLRSLVGTRGDASALADADVVVDPTGGRAGWPAVLSGRQVICYRVPPSGEAVAADLHDAGLAVFARTRTDLGLALGLALAEARDPRPTATSAPRVDPVGAIEAVTGAV